jgi:hypothetical protein
MLRFSAVETRTPLRRNSSASASMRWASTRDNVLVSPSAPQGLCHEDEREGYANRAYGSRSLSRPVARSTWLGEPGGSRPKGLADLVRPSYGPATRNLPKGHLIDGLQDLGDFGHPRHPSYRAPDFCPLPWQVCLLLNTPVFTGRNSRTARFPGAGSKVGLSDRTFPDRAPVKPAPGMPVASIRLVSILRALRGSMDPARRAQRLIESPPTATQASLFP